jgi:hypothetical protein
MNDKQREVIDYLNHCRDSFLNGSDWSWEKSLGVTEITDYLENISYQGKDCYVSFLFSQLTDKDKEIIDRNIDFYVNYEKLFAIYDL